MEDTSTVIGLFNQLGARLYYFESRRYLLEDSVDAFNYDTFDNYDYDETIYRIGILSNTIPNSQVVQLAEYYLDRVQDIKGKLEKPKYTWNIHVEKVVLSKAEQQKKFDSWMRELNRYETELMSLRNSRVKRNEPPVNTSSDHSKTITIQIDGNFKVGNYPDPAFQTALTNKQTAYFLSCLVRADIMPPYGPESIKKIAQIIFFKNGKNISDEMRLESYSTEDMREVIRQLEKMIDSIKNEIKKAR